MAVVPGMGTPISAIAGEDLSAYQYNLVKLNTSGQLEHFDAITDIPCGVLQNAPLSGEVGSFIPLGSGQSKIALGATLNPGVRFSGSAAGLAVAAAGTAFCAGILLEGGANGELGVAILAPLQAAP